jgi:hypothetical protein
MYRTKAITSNLIDFISEEKKRDCLELTRNYKIFHPNASICYKALVEVVPKFLELVGKEYSRKEEIH